MLSRSFNRAIETSQRPGVHAKLIWTDHQQSVHTQHVAERIEINSACDALAAWVKESEEDGRDFGALRALFAAIDAHWAVRHMIRLLVSYSHADNTFRSRLGTQLALLKRQGLLDVWADQAILPGQEIDPAIAAELEAADVIVLLVSPDLYRLELLLRDGNDARGRAASRR